MDSILDSSINKTKPSYEQQPSENYATRKSHKNIPPAILPKKTIPAFAKKMTLST